MIFCILLRRSFVLYIVTTVYQSNIYIDQNAFSTDGSSSCLLPCSMCALSTCMPWLVFNGLVACLQPVFLKKTGKYFYVSNWQLLRYHSSYRTAFRSVLSVPLTHCNVRDDFLLEKSCFSNMNMMCSYAPNGSSPHNINYRNRVYFGQYRTICK